MSRCMYTADAGADGTDKDTDGSGSMYDVMGHMDLPSEMCWIYEPEIVMQRVPIR